MRVPSNWEQDLSFLLIHDDDSGSLSERDTVTFAQRRKSYSSEWQRSRFLWHVSGGSVFRLEVEGQGGWWKVWR